MIKKHIKQHNLIEREYSLGILDSIRRYQGTERVQNRIERYRPGRSFTFMTGIDGAVYTQQWLGEGTITMTLPSGEVINLNKSVSTMTNFFI